MTDLLLRVFTHPACSGCPEAVREAWKLTSERLDVELRTVTLAEKEGLAEARRARVTTIPALILARGEEELARWQGVPDPGELKAAITAAAEGATSLT